MSRIYKVPIPGKDLSLEFCIDIHEYSKETNCIALMHVGKVRYTRTIAVSNRNGYHLGIQVSIVDKFLRVIINVEGKESFTYDIESSDFLIDPSANDYTAPTFKDIESIWCFGSCTRKNKRTPLDGETMQHLLSILYQSPGN